MKLKDGFITRTVQGTQMMVAVDGSAANFHGLVRSNETAAFIVDCLKSDTTEEQIVDRLLGERMGEYNVSREVAQRDVHAILEQLYGIGAIQA